MSPTMRRLSGRSARSSTSFPSSRIAIRVSRGAAFMRISRFIVARLTHLSATRRVKGGRFKKSPRGRVTGPRYEFLFGAHQRSSIHVSGTRESRGRPMHGEQHSRDNLPSAGLFPQRRQQLTRIASCPAESRFAPVRGRLEADSGHAVDEREAGGGRREAGGGKRDGRLWWRSTSGRSARS
jgi:hypothetical protein